MASPRILKYDAIILAKGIDLFRKRSSLTLSGLSHLFNISYSSVTNRLNARPCSQRNAAYIWYKIGTYPFLELDANRSKRR